MYSPLEIAMSGLPVSSNVWCQECQLCCVMLRSVESSCLVPLVRVVLQAGLGHYCHPVLVSLTTAAQPLSSSQPWTPQGHWTGTELLSL